MMPQTCPPKQELSSLLLGQLPIERAEAVEAHIETCHDCHTVVQSLDIPSDWMVSGLRAGDALSEPLEAGCDAALSRIRRFAPEATAVPAQSKVELKAEAADLGFIREYRMLAKLGEGGMGAVYKAQHVKLRRTVAVKVLPADKVNTPQAVARFEREMQAVGALDHQNIVRAFDAGEDQGRHYLVMEYVKGCDVGKLVQGNGRLPLAEACEIIRQSALGLQHAHEAGLVHRDIKPSNLMLAESGVVKILDLGLARINQEIEPADELTGTGQVMGTLDYMAPEQSGDTHHVDIRADIYSLGASLYRLLAGVAPFGDARYDTAVKKLMALATKEPAAVEELRPDVPRELAAVVKRMMAKSPDKRYGTPAEVAAALAPFAVGAKLASFATRGQPGATGDGLDASVSGSSITLAHDVTTPKVSTSDLATHVPNVERSVAPKPPATAVSGARKLPAMYVVVGAIAVGLAAILLGAIVLYLVTPEGGTVRVEINDKSITAQVDAKGINITQGEDKPIRVEAGEHALRIRHGDLDFETPKFVLKKGDKVRLKIEYLPGKLQVTKEGELFYSKTLEAPPEGRVQPRYALDFDFETHPGRARVALPAVLPVSKPFTIEMYVTARSTAEQSQMLFVAVEGPILKLYGNSLRWSGPPNLNPRSERVTVENALPLGRRTHLAAVSTGKVLLLFVDGIAKGKCDVVLPADRTSHSGIGGPSQDDELWRPLPALIDGVRISTIARYESDFQPPERLISDARTLILYEFLDGAGETLKDTSGNNNHGTIMGAKWVKVGSESSDEAGWTKLFNGLNLAGWKLHAAQDGEWKVNDGILVGSGPQSHLFSERGDYADFHLRCEARLNASGDSGVFFRAPYGFLPRGSRGWMFPDGYEAQLCNKSAEHTNTGSLYPLYKVEEALAKPGEWCKLEIIARDNRLTLKVNDRTAVDQRDEQRRFSKGHLVLQVFDPTTVVEFRRIEIKEFPPAAGASPNGSESKPQITPPRPSAALQALRRDQILPEALKMAGDGDANKAPANLVAILGQAQPSHSGEFWGLAFSPDGRWLATGNHDRNILVRDAATGKVQRVLRGHTEPVMSVAFSQDSRTLVSASHDGTLKFWPLDKEEGPRTVPAKLATIWDMAISADCRYLAAGGTSGQVYLWKWGQWDQPVEITPATKKGGVTSLAFSSDGELLAVGRVEDKPDVPVRIFATTDGKLTGSLTVEAKKALVPFDMNFSRDGKKLACFLGDHKAVVWDVASGKLDAEFPAWQWGTVTFSPDGQTLHVGGMASIVQYDLASQKVLRVLSAGHGCAQSAALSPDGKVFAAGFITGTLHVWDTTTWQEKYLEPGHLQHVRALAISPDGQAVLSAGNDDTLRLWDLARPGTNQIVHPFAAEDFHGAQIPPGPSSVAYSPDGKTFVLVVRGNGFLRREDQTAMIAWDATTLKERWRVRSHLTSVAFSPDGKTIAGACDDGTVRLWSTDVGAELHRFPALGKCAATAFSGDGTLLAAATWDEGRLKIWNVASGAEVHSWQDAPMTAAAFRPDGQFIAIGHQDGTISIWDLAQGKKQRTLRGHPRVQSLKFTPDGKTLVSSGHDGAIRVWNPEFERAQQVIAVGPANQRLLLDLDPSGQFVIAAGHGPLIYVLRLASAAALTP